MLYILSLNQLVSTSTMILCYVFLLCVVFVRGQVNTRVSELEINSAVTSDNLIVISGLNVYRDELVVLDTFSGIITVRTESMSVEREYFDRLNIAHVYSTVDDDTGFVALCTNEKGRCQYMNVSCTIIHSVDICNHRTVASKLKK